MASTNKTPKLGLNQWAAGDEVIRTDFNADNLAIEAGMEAAQALGTCVSGQFTPDGMANRAINVGFRPKFIFICGGMYGMQMSVGFIAAQYGATVRDSGGACSVGTTNSSDFQFTDTGFIIADADKFNKGGNTEAITTRYTAFR